MIGLFNTGDKIARVYTDSVVVKTVLIRTLTNYNLQDNLGVRGIESIEYVENNYEPLDIIQKKYPEKFV